MNEFNPVWIAVAISAIGAIASAMAAYFGTKIALAKVEQRQDSQGDHIDRLQRRVDDHDGLLADHAVSIGVLEQHTGLRGPVDYPRR